jgi:DNA-binding MarR family transcriptional regulator
VSPEAGRGELTGIGRKRSQHPGGRLNWLTGAAPGVRGITGTTPVVRLSNYECAVPRELGLTTPTEERAAPAIAALLTILRITRVLERIDAGVSPQQYRMLKLIGAGGERSARLAEKLAVARPTLTATADSLVAAGLACREAEPGDRRVVRLRLTEAGQKAVERADAAYAEWFGSLLEHTGRAEQIAADLLALDDAMTERRRARLGADADARARLSAGQQ